MGPDQVEEWYEAGLRVASISHYGVSTYSHGTGTKGGLLPPAKPLLEAFQKLGIIVDLTHLTDQAFWELLEVYDGPVLASHHNCRALVPGQRQLTDEMIRAIAQRNGVIGASLDSWMLDPTWNFDQSGNKQISKATLQSVADQIDHIAQLLGNTDHSGIGSDLDGGFGAEQTVRDLNTIADLQKLYSILKLRGYRDKDIRNVFYNNWIRLLRENMRH
jgi:membrane dipeptidase